MGMHTRVLLVILETFLFTIFVLNECKKLDGYKFPVYSTPFCPRNESEWNKRSSVLNCNKTNGYTCLPNENFTELLEFCYTQPLILIEEGYCLYLERKGSYVDSYSCRHFLHGCHNTSYQSIKIYEHPACISIGNGCFLAEQSCKSSSNITYRPETTENEKDDLLWVVILMGIIVFIVFFSTLMVYHCLKRRIRKQGPDIENSEEDMPLISGELQMDRAIFDKWNQEDSCFVFTKACKEVENNIKIENLVIVAGHSGSGKSAIIQHIALKYRKQGWNVRRVKQVEEILNECSSIRFQNKKTIFVLNDPLGKEYFDDILHDPWKTYEEELTTCLKTGKLLMSCRSHIISDARLARYLVDQSHIVNLDDDQYKLSVNEKRQILTKYTSAMNLSENDCDEIVTVEKYFPLLCKLYSSKEEYKNKGIKFFTEPVTVLKEEIIEFRNKDKGKYCALALLVLFNDDLRVSDLIKNKDTENKFEHTKKLCGLPKNTPPSDIGDYLNSMKDCFVKQVYHTYTFYHDFVMEVTSYVFGTDWPTETVKYADIGFLRRRVRIGNFEEHNDSFTIYLSDRYIQELGERLYNELFGERLLDVVLNPCLRHAKVIDVLKKKLADHPKNLQMLLKTKELKIDKQELYRTSEKYIMSKLEYLESNNEVCPLFVLIVFCHTQLSQYCVNCLKQKQIDLTSSFLIFAICCNGSVELFNSIFEKNAKESLEKVWEGFYPIHIVSLFQNHKLLHEWIKIGIDTNRMTGYESFGWTPLMLAAGNDTHEYGDYNLGETGAERRDKTVQLLLRNNAKINLCTFDGSSPLLIACKNGYDSTVQLLLREGANINLCQGKNNSPLHIACESGHNRIVHYLLSSGAKINLCNKDGISPLYLACQNGQNSTVQLLLENGADIALCEKEGASPPYIGHNSIVQRLLSKEANCKH